MPLISIRTSSNKIKDPEELLKSLSKELAVLTGKPEQYVMTSLALNQPMTFAGTNDPCCYVEIKSIGSLKPQEMSQILCDLISENTNIKSNRIYISFEDVPANLWGWNGRTFG